MATWNDAVTFCNEHYNDCYNCPIRGACWEERKDKSGNGRSSKDYENDMIEAVNSYQRKEKL